MSNPIPAPAEPGAAPAHPRGELEALRARILDQVLLLTGLGLCVTMVLALYKDLLLGAQWSLPVRLAAAVLVWGLYLGRHRLRYRLRAAVFVGCLWVIVGLSILNLGPVANSKGLLVLLTLLSMLLVSRAWGWASVVLVAVLIGGTGAAAVRGLLSFPLDYPTYVRTPVVWVQSAFGFTVYSLIAALAVSGMVRSLEDMAGRLAERVAALERLGGQLKEVLQRQRSVYHSSAVGIVVLDGSGRLLDVNAYARALLGQRRALLRQRPLVDLIDPADPTARRRLEAALARMRRVHLEARLVRPEGPGRWCELHLNPLDARQPARGATLVLVDVERRRLAEQADAAARALAEAANRDKDRVLAAVSHDLRTPLHALLAQAEALALSDQCRGPDAAALGELRGTARDLCRRVEDLLDLARLGHGGLRVQPRWCALGTLLPHVLGQVREPARAKGLRLDLRLAPGLPGQVRLDPDRLAQVLVNLLENAVKFTARGRVRLAARWRAGTAAAAGVLDIGVVDTGPGIPVAARARLFEPFFQVPPDPAASPPAAASWPGAARGLGLGLAICREVVDALGGRLAVQSRPGRGSRFRVELPVAARPAGPADGGAAAAASVSAPPRATPVEVREPGADPALGLALLAELRPRWQRLDPGDPAAIGDFAEAVQHLADAHAHRALRAWAERLARADARSTGRLLRVFRRFLPVPPGAADLARLRALVDLGLVTRIEDWCTAQSGRGPRTAAFAGLVRDLARRFDPEGLLRLVEIGMAAGSAADGALDQDGDREPD